MHNSNYHWCFDDQGVSCECNNLRARLFLSLVFGALRMVSCYCINYLSPAFVGSLLNLYFSFCTRHEQFLRHHHFHERRRRCELQYWATASVRKVHEFGDKQHSNHNDLPHCTLLQWSFERCLCGQQQRYSIGHSLNYNSRKLALHTCSGRSRSHLRTQRARAATTGASGENSPML